MQLIDIFLSMEGLALDGTAKKEREFEIYGRLDDLSVLERADAKEIQEQWGIPVDRNDENAGSGSIRVREINDGEKYILTTKVKCSDSNIETELETTKDNFVQFKYLARSGLRKIRYTFKTENDYAFEVDVFYQSNGELCNWVKIDLEVDESFSVDQMPDLPFEMSDVRVILPGKKNEADMAFVQNLFRSYYDLKNQYVK